MSYRLYTISDTGKFTWLPCQFQSREEAEAWIKNNIKGGEIDGAPVYIKEEDE